VPDASRDFCWDDPVFSILKAAACEAIDRSGLHLESIDKSRIGVVVGLSKGAVSLQSRWAADPVAMRSSTLAQRLGWLGVAPSAGAAFLSAEFGTKGPISAPITACATGLTAIRAARDLLASHDCDIVIAGAADASLTPFVESCFRRMRALATPLAPDDPPHRWVRPWAPDRNGFLIGEGGAVFVLERAKEVRESGRRSMAVIRQVAAGCEAHHTTRPDMSSTLLSRVVSEALETDGGLFVPDAIHLHATATRDFDAVESVAIRRSLGRSARSPWVMASKAQIGHCLGAAGAIELAICCSILEHDKLPPFDPASSADFPVVGRPVGPIAMRRPIGSVLKIVAGFGGHVEACLLTRDDDAARVDQ
jgi:3-oxoacyl-[acyl-carrier-protein] synthase II